MIDSKPSILFFGTPEFSLPSLRSLISEGYRLAGVVTNPDEPAGRKQILTPPPVKAFAQKRGIPVFQPPSLTDEHLAKELPEADLFIIVAYGKIIPKKIFDIPRNGALNIHPSFLPRWRGPSPIQYTILSGDSETGVTIIRLDERMDHGPIIANSKLQIIPRLQSNRDPGASRLGTNYKITYPELHDKLAKLGALLLVETLPKWLRGEIKPLPQDEAQATYSKILKKEDSRINWNRPGGEIERMIRAFNPSPGTWTLWPEKERIYRIKIEAAEFFLEAPPEGGAGYVWSGASGELGVKTGQGSIAIRRLTLGGRKPLHAETFLHGYPQIIGKTLI